MKKFRYIWLVLAMAVIVATLFAVMVSGSKKAEDPVIFLSISELFDFPEISGENVSRAEALHMLLVIAGEDKNASEASVESYFTDVKDNVKKEADYAYSKGIVFGDGDGLFFPNNEITLEEMLAMVLRVLGEDPADTETTFSLADTLKIYPDSASNSLCFFLSEEQCGEILWNLMNTEKPGAEGATFADALVSAGVIPDGAVSSIYDEIDYDFDAPHDVITNHIGESTSDTEPETTKPAVTTKPEVTTEGGWSPIWRP